MSVFAELSPPYSTIVADPPWHYGARPVGGSKPGTMAKAQPFPYSTMTLEEIVALPVDVLAASDAVLWLWTTNRYLPDSFAVMQAWGFTYRQTLVWGKNNPMPVGSVAPSAAEFLLVGKRGKPAVEWVWPSSVIVTSRPSERTHSVKPSCFMDYIEAASPAPRLELFCRRPRLGWDSWGHGYELGAVS
jgi:N6-adenosine-specific RNA methylase IME4